MKVNSSNYSKELKIVQQAEKKAFEADLDNIARDISQSILIRIDRFINRNTLPENERNSNVHPTEIRVSVVDAYTENVRYDDFASVRLREALRYRINVLLKPHGFEAKWINNTQDRNYINIKFGVTDNWKTVIKNIWLYIKLSKMNYID